jgi:hypothetical protein
MKMQQVRKITSKTVGLKSEPGFGFKLIGRLRSTAPGMTDKGPFLKLKGLFEAYPYDQDGNPLPGPFKSGSAIVPSVIEDELAEVLKTAQDADPSATVMFAYNVFLAKADNPMGREWRAEALSKPTEGAADPLAGMRALLGELPAALPPAEKPKALPKPKKKK